MNALELEVFSLHATCSSCPSALSKDERHKALLRSALSALKIRQAGRQAAPTCYMDRHKGHRIFLGPSNSFLLLSCPYWFGPFPLRCVPVVLIKHKHFIPTVWSRWKGTKKKKTKKKKLQTFTHDKELDTTEERWHQVPTCYKDIWKGHSISLNLLNFSRPPSCLGWYGSCLLQHDRVVLVRTKGWQYGMNWFFFFLVVAVCLQQKMKKKRCMEKQNYYDGISMH